MIDCGEKMLLALCIMPSVVFTTAAAAFVAPTAKKLHAARFTGLPSNGIGGGGGGAEDGFEIDGDNFYDDFGDFGELSSSDSKPRKRSISAAADPSFFESLQRRQRQLRRSSRELLQRWETGPGRSFPAFTLNEEFYRARQEEQDQVVKYGTSLGWYGSVGGSDDKDLPFDWVRRIDIGAYPRVACGSAYGSVYVADVEAGRLLGVARGVHSSQHIEGSVDAVDERLRGQIYGEYDGGGVLAVAMHGRSIVASAGREGGVKLFKLYDEGELNYVGDMHSLKRPLPGMAPVLVTSLEFDSLGRLFVGGQDGFLRMVTFRPEFALTNDPGKNADQMEVSVVSSPRDQMQRSPVLSMDVCEELDMVATAHANGNVCMHSLNRESKHNHFLGIWNPFKRDSTARSVAFVSGGDDEVDEKRRWSVVVGGGNGELWMQEIHPSRIPMANCDGGDEDWDVPDKLSAVPLFESDSIQQITPSHGGPVLSLASRPDGILVSASQGGALCMTRLWPVPETLYGLGGYKVWIGNVCIDADGKRLLSDGRDDVVVVHDFSHAKEDDDDGEL